MNSGLFARRGAATFLVIGTFCLGAMGGCAQSRENPIAGRPAGAAVDLFGETPPSVDASKAHVALADLPPVVPTPARRAAPLAAPSSRAADALKRALALRGEKRYTEATIELEKALRYEPDSALIHRELALTLWEAGNNDRARAHIEKALAAGEDDMVSHYLLGRLAAKRFENDEAIRHLRTALACTADDSTAEYQALARYHLADILAAEGYLAAAIELYTDFLTGLDRLDASRKLDPAWAALPGGPGGAAHEQLAWAHGQLGRYDLAAKHFGLAYADRDMNAAKRLVYAKLLARAGDLAQAADEARAVLKTDRAAIDVLAVIYAKSGTPDAIIDDLRRLADDQPDDIDLALALADTYVRFNRSDEAVAFLRQCAGQRPDQPKLTWALFDLLTARRQWTEAFDVAAGAVRDRSSWAMEAETRIKSLAEVNEAAAAWLAGRDASSAGDADFATAYLLGAVACELGRREDARLWLERSVAARPTFVPARASLAEIHNERYAWAEAIAVAGPPDIELEPDTRLEHLLGDAYAGLDVPTAAVEHYENAIRLNRANSAAMLALSKYLLYNRQRSRALRQLETLVNADPLNEEAREALFNIYHSGGDHRAAAEQIAELRRLVAAPTRIARCVATLELNPTAAGHEARFRQTLFEAAEKYHMDAETLLFIARSFMRERRFEQAEEALNQALVMEPRNLDCAELLAGCYWGRLEFEQALAHLRVMAQRYPNRLMWKGGILDLLLVLQRFEEAAAYASTLLADPTVGQPLDDAIRNTLVEAHLLAKADTAAIEVLEMWRRTNPSDVSPLLWEIQIYQRMGQADKALELIRVWRDIPAGGFSVGRGDDVWAKLPPEHHDEVVQLVLDAIDADPDQNALQMRLIEVLRATGRFEEAIELAKNNIPAGRDAEPYQYEIYMAYQQAGRVDDAVDTINEIMIESASTEGGAMLDQSVLRVDLAELLIRAERYSKAISKINLWLEGAASNLERIMYLQLLARCHHGAGNVTEAIDMLTQAVELEPSETSLANELGYTLADAGLDLDRAEELIRTAVADNPRQSAYLDSLGWVLYKKGDFEAARTWLVMSRQAGSGEDPIICDHLGDTCWRLGDRAAARSWWDEAIKFGKERVAEVLPRPEDLRTLKAAQGKIESVEQDREPEVAPLAQVPPPSE